MLMIIYLISDSKSSHSICIIYTQPINTAFSPANTSRTNLYPYGPFGQAFIWSYCVSICVAKQSAFPLAYCFAYQDWRYPLSDSHEPISVISSIGITI